MSCQSRFDARYWMLGAGALGRPRGMVLGGRREEEGLGSTCIPVADSFRCLAKLIQCLRFKNKIKLKKILNGPEIMAQNVLASWRIKHYSPYNLRKFPRYKQSQKNFIKIKNYKIGGISLLKLFKPYDLFGNVISFFFF